MIAHIILCLVSGFAATCVAEFIGDVWWHTKCAPGCTAEHITKMGNRLRACALWAFPAGMLAYIAWTVLH